jgi:hypothetical protein
MKKGDERNNSRSGKLSVPTANGVEKSWVGTAVGTRGQHTRLAFLDMTAARTRSLRFPDLSLVGSRGSLLMWARQSARYAILNLPQGLSANLSLSAFSPDASVNMWGARPRRRFFFRRRTFDRPCREGRGAIAP